MINYILQVILFQVLFLAVYDFFLSKETFFNKNRWYLLSTPVLSFLIPLIKISTFYKVVPEEFEIQLPEIVLNPDKVIQQTITASNFTESINYMTIIFWVGVALFLILFLMKLVKIISFIRKHKVIKQDDFYLILIPNETKAFSFFNYVFLGDSIKETNRDKIIQHEMVHSKQKHSLDLLFFEVLKIVMWFNPMIYFYQKRITLVHEYISDAIVAKSESKETYINNLLSNFFQVENIAFINQFYKQTLIKKRIIMITKNKSKKMNQLKYLVLIPVLASMLFYTSCVSNRDVKKVSETKEIIDTEKEDFQGFNLNTRISDGVKVIDAVEKNLKVVQGYNYDSKLKEGENIVVSEEEFSFSIDKIPTFSGCDYGDRECFGINMKKHFDDNFNYKMIYKLGLATGTKLIAVGFTIDEKGNVIEAKAQGNYPNIKNEAIRVIKTLPKMIPEEFEGDKVAVKYSIPFSLTIE